MKTLADAPFVNPFDPEFRDHADELIAPIQAESWLAQTMMGGMVVGRAQVQALLSDRRLKSGVALIVAMQGVEGPVIDRMQRSILAVDGEDHLRLRRLANRAFTPRAVEVHRAHMAGVLDELLAPLRPTGRAELMADVCDHYPIRVMCHLLGVPEEDHEDFAAWNRAITWALSFELGQHLDEVQWGLEHMEAYVTELMADRRSSPRDDMVTALVQAEEGDDRLTDDEVRTMISSLLFAGYDTTRNQLGLAAWALSQHPDQWGLLAERPELAGPAVEEVMRAHGAVGGTARVVLEDLEYEGYAIPAGTVLMLSMGAANHDRAAYEHPERFDITAEREPHLTFGGGPHYCLGASLARAEMQEALPRLARAMPDLALDGEPTWRPATGIFGPETLPVRFTPTA